MNAETGIQVIYVNIEPEILSVCTHGKGLYPSTHMLCSRNSINGCVSLFHLLPDEGAQVKRYVHVKYLSHINFL